MEIRKPVWYLKKLCPECEQGDSLILVKCPQCGKILVQCDEELTVFLDYKNVSKKNIYSGKLCPKCNKAKIDTFIPLDAEEIQSLGFSKEDYH